MNANDSKNTYIAEQGNHDALSLVHFSDESRYFHTELRDRVVGRDDFVLTQIYECGFCRELNLVVSESGQYST